jgi:hypothetical protein
MATKVSTQVKHKRYYSGDITVGDYDLSGTDLFRPPKFTIEVVCIHCKQRYHSNEMVFETRYRNPFPLWWCKNRDCDGAGFRFDIFPVDSSMGRGILGLPESPVVPTPEGDA